MCARCHGQGGKPGAVRALGAGPPPRETGVLEHAKGSFDKFDRSYLLCLRNNGTFFEEPELQCLAVLFERSLVVDAVVVASGDPSCKTFKPKAIGGGRGMAVHLELWVCVRCATTTGASCCSSFGQTAALPPSLACARWGGVGGRGGGVSFNP